MICFLFTIIEYCVFSEQTSTKDLLSMPFLTFSDVEKFSGEVSSRAGIQKAYKFFAEPGYLFDYHGM